HGQHARATLWVRTDRGLRELRQVSRLLSFSRKSRAAADDAASRYWRCNQNFPAVSHATLHRRFGSRCLKDVLIALGRCESSLVTDRGPARALTFRRGGA